MTFYCTKCVDRYGKCAETEEVHKLQQGLCGPCWDFCWCNKHQGKGHEDD